MPEKQLLQGKEKGKGQQKLSKIQYHLSLDNILSMQAIDAALYNAVS